MIVNLKFLNGNTKEIEVDTKTTIKEIKVKFLSLFLPPIIAICSLILFSSTFIYFYNPVEDKEKNELINPE